jgi:hypothetical protein
VAASAGCERHDHENDRARGDGAEACGAGERRRVRPAAAALCAAPGRRAGRGACLEDRCVAHADVARAREHERRGERLHGRLPPAARRGSAARSAGARRATPHTDARARPERAISGGESYFGRRELFRALTCAVTFCSGMVSEAPFAARAPAPAPGSTRTRSPGRSAAPRPKTTWAVKRVGTVGRRVGETVGGGVTWARRNSRCSSVNL